MITRVMAGSIRQLSSAAVFSASAKLHGMASGGPVESSIKNKLEGSLHPTHIEIINESFMHNVPPGSETHFKVLVVSESFTGLPLIKARTPDQWAKEPQEIERSPACQGGFGK